MNRKLFFLSVTDSGYSPSWTHFSGISQENVDLIFQRVRSGKVFSDLMEKCRDFPNQTHFIVTSPGQYIVPLARLVLGKRLGENMRSTYKIKCAQSMLASQFLCALSQLEE